MWVPQWARFLSCEVLLPILDFLLVRGMEFALILVPVVQTWGKKS